VPILGRRGPVRRSDGTEESRTTTVVAEPDGPEDRKPLSDEARSAFTPPLGVERPPVPEE